MSTLNIQNLQENIKTVWLKKSIEDFYTSLAIKYFLAKKIMKEEEYFYQDRIMVNGNKVQMYSYCKSYLFPNELEESIIKERIEKIKKIYDEIKLTLTQIDKENDFEQAFQKAELPFFEVITDKLKNKKSGYQSARNGLLSKFKELNSKENKYQNSAIAYIFEHFQVQIDQVKDDLQVLKENQNEIKQFFSFDPNETEESQRQYNLNFIKVLNQNQEIKKQIVDKYKPLVNFNFKLAEVEVNADNLVIKDQQNLSMFERSQLRKIEEQQIENQPEQEIYHEDYDDDENNNVNPDNNDIQDQDNLSQVSQKSQIEVEDIENNHSLTISQSQDDLNAVILSKKIIKKDKDKKQQRKHKAKSKQKKKEKKGKLKQKKNQQKGK